MKDTSALTPGKRYILSDYATKYMQPDTNIMKTGSVERLILTAISVNKFAVECSSLDYPNDIIQYNFDMNVCEDGATARTGFILRRYDPIDHLNAPFDWRKMVWARYTPNPTQYSIAGVLTNYAVWTSGAAVPGRIYKVGDALYMAIIA